MFKFKRIVLILIAVVFSALLYACKNTSTTETTTPVQADISMRVSNGYIQWRVGDGQWNNLIAIDQLQGQDGKGIRSIDVNDDNELVITYDDNSTKNLGVIKGPKGDKGDQGDPGIGIKAIEIDDDGNLVITLDNDTVITLGKVVGRDGQDGIDGREVEFRLNDGYLQWRYVGEPDDAWDNLFSLDDIRGEDGEDGLNGLSAYELYKLYNPNYDKTEEEWLSDLINGRLAEVETVTITFHPNNGDAVFTEEVVKGHTTNLPILERLGYRFLGWYSSEEDSQVEGRFTNFIPVVRDIDLYARWELIPLEGIILTEYELELEEEETYQIEVTPVPDDALLPELVFETSDPTIATVDADGLITAIKAGTVTITVRDEDSEFVETIELTVVDKTDPVLISVEPEEGEVVIKDGESFVFIVRAFDKNLYELEIDHSLEDILPEFSVYADEDNPYGSLEDKAKFESYGVTVTYDADTQTWTIDFGDEITANFFLAAQQVRFFIVIHDIYGNTWGTMYGTTPENTFVYDFISYDDYVLRAIKAAEDYEAMRDAIALCEELSTDFADLLDQFAELPEDGSNQQAIIQLLIDYDALLGFDTLDEVYDVLELAINYETSKYSLIEEVNAAHFADDVNEALLLWTNLVNEYNEEVIALGLYPELEDSDFTLAISELWDLIDMELFDKVERVAEKLFNYREELYNGAYADEEEFAEALLTAMYDLDDPLLKSVTPAEGLITIKDDSFKLVIVANDKTLYELEVDHSLQGILPEFSVYASVDNPYGSEEARDQFLAYGVIVTYDADTQTWTIDFGMDVTRVFIEAGTVTFYFVLVDEQGYTWGSMYTPTPDNTFVYEFEDYYVKALNAIKSAETTNGMLNALTTYQDAVNISEEAWDLFNELPDPSDYRANVLHHIIVLSHYDLLGSLEDVKAAFEFMAEKEYYKYMTTVLLNNATDEETVFDIINERFPVLFAYRQELLSLGTYPDLVDDTYTEVVTEINDIIDANNIDKLTKISAKLLEFAPFTDIYDVMDALASILISDLYNPELVGVEVVEPIEHDNDFVLVKDKFVWIIKASDQTLFKLEVDHSFEGTLPEFSVYASEDNPYGSLEAKAEFEALGVTVTYDADTQTWTIDFGTTVTAMLLDAGQVTFYIVLYDEQGYTWGSMYNVTPENTFTYVLKDYYEYAYEQIMATTTAEALVAEILKFQDAVNLDPALVEAYEEFSNTSKTDVATVIHAYKSANYLNSLGDIKYYFELLVTNRL